MDHPPSWCIAHRGGDEVVLPRPARAVQGADAVRDGDGAAEVAGRQGPAAHAAAAGAGKGGAGSAAGLVPHDECTGRTWWARTDRDYVRMGTAYCARTSYSVILCTQCHCGR